MSSVLPDGFGAAAGGGDTDALDSSYLTACVVESRSREVCVALMSTLRTHVLQVYLVTDTQSYGETLDLLQNLRPKEVLLHDSSQKRPLARKVAALSSSTSSTTRTCVPVFVSRRYFDQDQGVELLRKLSVQVIDANILESYIFLSSCNALIKYLEATAGLKFLPKSLKIEQSYGHGGRLVIDRRTARDLELICNSKNGSQKTSLFGVINHTKTDVGARTLRSNILSPLTDLNTIEMRLDLVEFLVANSTQEDLDAVGDALSAFVDLDKMLSGIATPPVKEDDLLSAKKMIDCVMLLKTSMDALPVVVEKLQLLVEHSNSETGNELLDAIIGSLSLPVYAEITAQIAEFLTDSTTYSRNVKTRRLQECFAINPGISGLLDVARKTFIQSVEDIYELCTQYSKTYALEVLRVNYTAARGYYLSMPSASVSALPDIFIQCNVSKKTLTCSTEELISLSARAEESNSQCIILTNQVLRGNLLDSIRESMDALFKAVEAIAILDMLFSFVELILSEEGPYCRPTMRDSGPLAIKQGRDPLAAALSPDPFIANDTYLAPFANFLVVMGPNGGGKTTMLKQTALIVIMSQIGCYVPAEEAVISVRDRLLTQLFSGDDMETNLSSFMLEMRMASYIVENATARSLIIIDELGRGASTHDGAALAFAISEALLSKAAFTMLVTHYQQLRSLSAAYSNVRNVHMAARITDQQKLKFLHKVTSGCTPPELSSGYGLMMARMVGFPPHILEQAERHKQVMEKHVKAVETRLSSNQQQGRQTAEEQAVQILRRLVMASTLEGTALRNFLQDLREKVVTAESDATMATTGIAPSSSPTRP